MSSNLATSKSFASRKKILNVLAPLKLLKSFIEIADPVSGPKIFNLNDY